MFVSQAESVPSRPMRVLLYGDGNINLIDGSTIWLVSMAEVLARTGAHVTLFLKAKANTRRTFVSLDRLDNVTVVDPFEKLEPSPKIAPLTVDEVAAHVCQLDQVEPFDVVLVRGSEIAKALTRTGRFDGRLWPYVIDVPGPEVTPTPAELAELAEIALASDRMLVQTEDSRAYMEYRVPESVGKCFVILPMIPDDLRPLEGRRAHVDTLVGVYSGKFAMPWRTLELAALPEQLGSRGISLALSMVGDKIMHSAVQPNWKKAMSQALRDSPGLLWTGGMAREDALAYCRTAQVGFSWRARELDSTHEISTKVLEYCAMGVAPVLNRIQAHVDLLGEDYALFVEDDPRSVADAVARVAHDPELLTRSQDVAVSAVSDYRMSAAAERIGAALAASGRRQGVGAVRPQTPVSVLVVGRELPAVSHLVNAARAVTPDVRVVELPDAPVHEPIASSSVDDPAGTSSVVVFSAPQPPTPELVEQFKHGRRLVVHVRDAAAVDADTPPGVDAYLFDTETQRRDFADGGGELEAVHAPVVVDAEYYDRPGDPARATHVGVLDFAPSRRRPDLALDVLEGLHEAGCEAVLHLRGDLPWLDAATWADPAERDYYRELFDRIEASPVLRDHVSFEPAGADLPNWWGRLGWVLETVDQHSVDLRLLQAAAGGALVRVPRSDLVADLYGADAAYDSLAGFVADVVRLSTDAEAFEDASRRMRAEAARHSSAAVADRWREVLVGPAVPTAQAVETTEPAEAVQVTEPVAAAEAVETSSGSAPA
jgi:hypothetical protein